MKTKLTSIRRWMIFFMVSLFFSGLTAIPLEAELSFLTKCFPIGTALGNWLDRVYLALVEINGKHPFIAYGFDWLAFAHFILAILFIGPYREPVKNKWVIEFGMIACILVIPFAFIAGNYRGIPMGWILIDCSFGVIGLFPLAICLNKIKQLEKEEKRIERLEHALPTIFA